MVRLLAAFMRRFMKRLYSPGLTIPYIYYISGIIQISRYPCASAGCHEEDVTTVAVSAAQTVNAHWRDGAVVIVAAVVDGNAVHHPTANLFGHHPLEASQLLAVGTHQLVADAGREDSPLIG